ncbi:anti-sigma factor family protein [Vulgatibacter sp.]|uniref:anti-sigma factor family protein n=1 Tax=Vulgatibacter sp. TaxID=1971226 RepID=UPI0035640937
MNTHQEVIELFSPYVDASLPAAQEAAFEAHLAQCGPCRAEYAGFAEAVALVRELPRHRLPAAFGRRVLARTRTERRRRLSRIRELVLPVFPAGVAVPLVLVAALAALVVLLFLSI